MGPALLCLLHQQALTVQRCPLLVNEICTLPRDLPPAPARKENVSGPLLQLRGQIQDVQMLDLTF